MTVHIERLWKELTEVVSLLKPQVIFFDLDDTLFDAEWCYDWAHRQIGIERGGDAFKRARNVVKERIPLHTSARNRLLYFKCLLEQQMSSSFSAVQVMNLMDRYETALLKAVELDWARRRGFLLPILSFLKRSYRLGMITNENVRTQLLKLSVIDPDGEIFEKVIISEEHGIEKPDPLIFQHACKRFNVQASQALMVGDSLQADIEGAERFGMRAVWVKATSLNLEGS